MTPKQEAFVREYPLDSNATQAAVRAGYSSRTAGSIGEELLKKPEIAAAIAEGRRKLADRAEMTVDQHLADLKAIRDAALAEGKYSAAAAAEIARGRVAGFYVERLEHSGRPTVVFKDYTGRATPAEGKQ